MAYRPLARQMNFIVHYAELGIKGKNREYFEERLVSNIKTQLKGLSVIEVRRRTGLVRVEVGFQNAPEVQKRLQSIAGIATVMPCVRLPLEPEAILAEGARAFASKKGSFRVTARRSD